MQQFKFIIPQNLDDLLHPVEDPNIYYVNDELTSLEIAHKLPELENSLKSEPLNISEEFGVFFSILKNFSDIDPRVVDISWTILFKTTNLFRDQLKEIFRVLIDNINANTSIGNLTTGGDVLNKSLSSQHNLSLNTSLNCSQQRVNLFESLQEKSRYSNALKMLIYINCTFINHFEDALSSQSHRKNFNDSVIDPNNPSTPANRKKKRPRIEEENTREISLKEYDRYKERVLKNLLELISIQLNKVADSMTESQEIVSLVMRVCYKLIENSAFNNITKQKDLLDIIFSVLGLGVEKYNQSMSFSLKYIQLLQYREQLAPLLADSVEFIVTRHDQRLLIGEILREIDRIDIKDLSRDSSCPRAVSTFLVNLSEKCPNEFIPSLDNILGYLEQDSYIMRNSSLVIIANLLIKALHDKNQEEDIVLRDDLLNVLLSHIQDITGYTRSKVLSVWCTLCEKECIPLTYRTKVTKAAVERLKDKSCLVRKNALKLIISNLNTNPFAPKLPLKFFIERHETESKLLNKLLEEEKEKEAREEEVLETISQDEDHDQTITDDTDPEKIQPKLRMSQTVLSEESPTITQERKVTFLRHAIEFIKLIHEAIPITTDMLHSKNITDIQEAIDFFVFCHEFGIDEALVGFKKMILLINVQEKAVKDTISSAYKRIFFESSRYEGKPNKTALVISNFINFVETATVGEYISLEILLGQFLQSGDFTKEMERELWARFTRAKPNITIDEMIYSIQLLGMLAYSQPDIINHNLQHCVHHGLSTNGCTEQESRLVRETCIAIRKSIPRKIEDKRKSLRLARDDVVFTRLETILVESLISMESEHWFSMCDEVVKIIFDTAENPEQIAESIFKQMSENLLANAIQSNILVDQDTNRNESPDLVFQPTSIHLTGSQGSQTQAQTMELVNPIILSRFIHFLGDVALDLAVFLELHVLLELKIRNATENSNTSLNNISAHNISISSRRRSRRYGAANKSTDDQNLEEEIGLGGAEGEDAEMEFIASICDEEVVCGKNLLAKLSRVIIEVVTDPFRYPNTELKQASVLALAKYMMVSAKYCQDHLRLLFTILEKTKDSEIKINLLIAISDLCIRFPNQLDGWTGKIFDCLQSEEVKVRRAALKILSRLVLCDILKAKDQISTMANLIVDQDEQISSYSRHFFLELSKKLNAIYNVLPDIISRLSDSKTGISEENFRIVMVFIFELIDKSHHIDRLVDKLCGRFMDTDDERHWSDLAFCLSLLKYSDKSMVKLMDKFDCYKDKLCIDSVFESITTALSNYRKTPHLKNEMKQLLDEFEARVQRTKAVEMETSKTEAETENETSKDMDTTETEEMETNETGPTEQASSQATIDQEY